MNDVTRNAALVALVILAAIATAAWLFGSSFSMAGNTIGRALPATIAVCIGAVLIRLLYLAAAGATGTIKIVAGMTLALIVIGYFGFLWLLTARVTGY